jgi:hypothetical protein
MFRDVSGDLAVTDTSAGHVSVALAGRRRRGIVLALIFVG